jgi:hypothetical protein
MKTSHHLYVVVLFKDGLIGLVATLSMIDHILIYAHDYYVFELYFLYYIINNRGRYLDETINWLHWLYDFT